MAVTTSFAARMACSAMVRSRCSCSAVASSTMTSRGFAPGFAATQTVISGSGGRGGSGGAVTGDSLRLGLPVRGTPAGLAGSGGGARCLGLLHSGGVEAAGQEGPQPGALRLGERRGLVDDAADLLGALLGHAGRGHCTTSNSSSKV